MEERNSTGISSPEPNQESPSREGNDTDENDFPFGDLTLETSEDIQPAHASEGTPEISIPLPNEFEEESIPRFFETIPSLQEMSSLVVAITLWQRVTSQRHNSSVGYYEYFDIGDYEVEKLLLQLPVPRLIREIVENHLPDVRDEMQNWLWYYKDNLYTPEWGDLSFCCWLPNGKIDQRESALKMLSNPRLTLENKFTTMAKFCLENEIKKLSAESLPSSFTSRYTWRKNPLMYYWLCYVNGNLNDIPKVKREPIISHLVTSSLVNNWPAFEYFWHQLDDNEQISKFVKIIAKRPHFQKNLLFKMNITQKFHLFSKFPFKIIRTFWKNLGQERFILQTWIYIRNFVDYKQFKEMMTKLHWKNFSRNKARTRCMVDIWNHTPDHLKNAAFEVDFANIVIMFSCTEFYYRQFSDIEFLMTYLSDADAEFRKRVIFERPELIVLLDVSISDRVIKFCLPNASDVEKFKKYILGISDIQEGLYKGLRHNYLENVNTFLDYFCTDFNTIRGEFCCKILEYFIERDRKCYTLDQWFNIIKLVDESILNIFPDQALKFKKYIALSFKGYFCEEWSNDDKMSKIIEIFTQFLDADELARFKLKALEEVRKYYEWERLINNASILWCCNNDHHKVREFKETLSIDDIFRRIWCRIKSEDILQTDLTDDHETMNKIFEPLDRSLLWCFEDEERVRRFKLEKVFTYCEFFRDDYFTKNILRWFFGGDEDAIKLFKEMDNDEQRRNFVEKLEA